MAEDSLLPSNLLPLALSLLPSSITSASPTSTDSIIKPISLNNPIEALGLLIHSIHSSLGFRLIEPKPLEPKEGESETSNELPLNWNSNGSPKFKYKHEQSSLDFIISVVELGGRALIAAVAVEDNKSVTFDLLLTDYFSLSAFPFTAPPPSFTNNNSFATLFSSPSRIKDLITLYRLNILQPLIPGLRKDGYTELDKSTSPATASNGGASGSGANRGYLPDTGGPLGIYGGGQGGGGGGYGIPIPRLPNLPNQGGPSNPLRLPNQQNPYAIGSRDLDPLGGQIPSFPGFPGSNGPNFGGVGGIGDGGGMYMGPNHPLFRERFGPDGRLGGGGDGEGRVWGGDGWLPQGSVPPGARFDPIGPTNGPPGAGGLGGPRGIGGFPGRGGGRGGFPGMGGMGGGRGGFGGGMGGGFNGGSNRNIGGDPDWDELPPPGDSSDYDAMFG